MTVQEYINASGGAFWRYPAVLALMGVIDGLCFYWSMQPLRKQTQNLRRSMLFLLLLTGIGAALQFTRVSVAVHCAVCLVMWTICMHCFVHRDWIQSLCGSCMYCLCVELARLLCRDGFLALLLMKLMPDVSYYLLHILLLVLYLLFLLLMTWLLRQEMSRIVYLTMDVRQLFCLLFPMLLYLTVRQVGFWYLDSMANLIWYWIELLQIAIACCAEIVLICTVHMLSVEKERNELLKKQILFEKRQQQYRIQEASIRSVNRKYHDLKHYIAGVEALGGQEAGRFVQTLKEQIESYESIQKTGNEVMDILLSERMEECRKKGIRLVPYVDGRQLSFLNAMDLCAIFGNAMDNAIEAAEKVTYVNMREISVKIGVSDGMLLMRFQNYFDGTLKQQDGQILTSKEDGQEHGYGLENIRMIAEQYDGAVACETNGQEFSLHVLIPLPQ
jgi:hypothetical protein